MSTKPRKSDSLPVKVKRKLPETAKATQFAKGVSGNPGGRPKNSIVARLRAAVEADSGRGDGSSVADVIVEKLIGMATHEEHPDRTAIVEILDRVDGKATQTVKLGNTSPAYVVYDSSCSPQLALDDTADDDIATEESR